MRSIDADAVYEALTDYYHHRTEFQHDALRDALDRVPTIDAVSVVRCKECKHWVCNPNTEEWGKCKWISDEQFDVVMNDDDFCSYGERRTE